MEVDFPQKQPLVLRGAGEGAKILASFFMSARSPLMALEYRLASDEFFRFLGGEIRGPEDLRRHHIVFYRKWLEENGLANKTIQKKLAALSSLCKYLAEAGLIDKDIAYGVARPQSQNRRETADIADEDVKRIFSGLDPKSYVYASHKAILALGFFTGLCSAEIRGLQMKSLGRVQGMSVLNLKVKAVSRTRSRFIPSLLGPLTRISKRSNRSASNLTLSTCCFRA